MNSLILAPNDGSQMSPKKYLEDDLPVWSSDFITILFLSSKKDGKLLFFQAMLDCL
jgi:hypothetical protein